MQPRPGANAAAQVLAAAFKLPEIQAAKGSNGDLSGYGNGWRAQSAARAGADRRLRAGAAREGTVALACTGLAGRIIANICVPSAIWVSQAAIQNVTPARQKSNGVCIFIGFPS
jgi:hypothetical protein